MDLRQVELPERLMLDRGLVHAILSYLLGRPCGETLVMVNALLATADETMRKAKDGSAAAFPFRKPSGDEAA